MDLRTLPRVAGGFIARTAGAYPVLATWSVGLVSLFEPGLTTQPDMLFQFLGLCHSINWISIV